MQITREPENLPVLLLYNVDPAWEGFEQDEAIQQADLLQTGLGTCGYPVTGVAVEHSDLREHLRGYSPDEYIVLNMCESLPGIDHSEALVAYELSVMGYVFTGSSSDVLALSWDKPCVNQLLADNNIPTPNSRLYRTLSNNGWHTYPAIVKPAYEHCSFGVTREAVVVDANELRSRVGYILDTFHQPALVEDFIDGREFHVSVWGADELEVLPAAEMDFVVFGDIHDRLCTYDSKFIPGSIAYDGISLRLPAVLSPEEEASLRQVSLGAYRAVGCRDYARMDIRLRDGTFYVLDVNPNADLSSGASMACAAEVAGYSFGVMVSYLVELASRRHPRFGTRDQL
ncbi:MAG: D-alanine--D-alanine ligase family protein [Anaerolineae bacterium]